MELAKIRVTGVDATVTWKKDIPSGIVGATVTVEYEHPAWTALAKTAVFLGCVAKDVAIAGETIRIPPETVAEPGCILRVGFYGVHPETGFVTPTFWTELGRVRKGTDPSGDPSTDPSLPVWGQIAAMIGDLGQLDTEAKETLVAAVNEALTKGGGTVDEETVQRIVAEYLAENPIPTGATEEQAAQIQANKEAIEELQQGSGNVDLTGVVKSVNGVTPDENGNVEIAVSGGGGGMSSTASALLISILRSVYIYNGDQSANITALEAALATGGGSGGEEEPDTPVDPDEPVTPEITLSSISATYSGGDVAVGTAVTDLTGIVVTAHYSDGTSETVTGYTLSGTIAEGENVITVVYSGKATTFTVTGFAEVDDTPLYSLPSPLTGDGSKNDANTVDTGIALCSEDIDFTIAIKCNVGKGTLFSNRSTASPYAGITLNSSGDAYDFRLYANSNSNTEAAFAPKQIDTAMILVHAKGSGTYTLHYAGTDKDRTITSSNAFISTENTIKLGYMLWSDGGKSEYINGTISEFKIYNRVFTADEIAAYVE